MNQWKNGTAPSNTLVSPITWLPEHHPLPWPSPDISHHSHDQVPGCHLTISTISNLSSWLALFLPPQLFCFIKNTFTIHFLYLLYMRVNHYIHPPEGALKTPWSFSAGKPEPGHPPIPCLTQLIPTTRVCWIQTRHKFIHVTLILLILTTPLWARSSSPRDKQWKHSQFTYWGEMHDEVTRLHFKWMATHFQWALTTEQRRCHIPWCLGFLTAQDQSFTPSALSPQTLFLLLITFLYASLKSQVRRGRNLPTTSPTAREYSAPNESSAVLWILSSASCSGTCHAPLLSSINSSVYRVIPDPAEAPR